MAQAMATAGGFIILQLVFGRVERWAEHGHKYAIIAWCCHPVVVKGAHDWGIWLLAEAHTFVGR